MSALALLALVARPASAESDPEPGHATDPGPEPRLFFGGLDRQSHDDFSSSASAASDALLVLGLTAPLALELGRNDDDTGRRLGVYAGGVAASGLVAAAMKELWRRPRPYNFHADPAVRDYARRAGKDASVSFPSGHTALTFAAAAAGGWIYASGSDDMTARAGVWFGGSAVAGATAVLRMRAGKHYPSDVAMGALIGVAGVAVPAAVLGDVQLSGGEIAAMAGGVLIGAGIASVIPFDHDVVVPLVVPGGGGVAITGTMR